jgi:hypothetical protein
MIGGDYDNRIFKKMQAALSANSTLQLREIEFGSQAVMGFFVDAFSMCPILIADWLATGSLPSGLSCG